MSTAVVPRTLLRIERDQRLIGAGLALGQQPRVPGDLLGRVLQEVRGREARPGALDVGRGHAALAAAAARAASCVSRTSCS